MKTAEQRRLEVIAYLYRLDPNGDYADDASEGMGPLTLPEALKLCVTQLAEAATDSDEYAKEWLTFLEEFHGGGFHPDSRFTEYVNDNGERTYTDEEAATLQQCFNIVADYMDVYTVLSPLAEARIAQANKPNSSWLYDGAIVRVKGSSSHPLRGSVVVVSHAFTEPVIVFKDGAGQPENVIARDLEPANYDEKYQLRKKVDNRIRAAAPDLLKQLKVAAEVISDNIDAEYLHEDSHPGIRDVLKQLRDTIAKAEGK